jgi:hypothetical protein
MIAAQVAVSLSVLMSILAVLVDGGLLLVERRHAQATADAAALAAASDLFANWKTNSGSDTGGTAASSALGVASANGYTNDGTTNSVTVNIPPASGNFSGKAGYAEVIVTWNQKRGFSAIFGSGTIPVSARAVAIGATSYTSGTPAILLLGNTGTTLSGVGNGSITVTGTSGSIYVDSTGPSSASMSGNGSASAPYIYLSQTGSAGSGLTATVGSVQTGAPQLSDPLAYLPTPPSSSNAGTGISVDSSTYAGGLSGSATLTSNTIYIVGGNGISLTGNATVTGTNVMIYLSGSNAGVKIAGNGSLNITPLASGPYEGISMFQSRSDSTGWDLHGNGNNISGTIYAPAANITDTGNGATDVLASQIIANSLTMKGNGATVSFSPSSALGGTGRRIGLVE